MDLLSASYYIELVATTVAGLSVVAIVLGSLASALSGSTNADGNTWRATGPLVTWAVTSLTTGLVLAQIDTYATVIQRLGQFSGASDYLAHLHAALFVSLVTVTTARAFFVVSEMDKGRYAGREDVPRAIATRHRLRKLEFGFRLLIILFLTLFASTFLRITLPGGFTDLAIAGRPDFLKSVSQSCAVYENTIASLGFGAPPQDCILSRLSELPKDEVLRLALVISGPLKGALPLAYLSMIIWCGIVWRATCSSAVNREWIKSALLLQLKIVVWSGTSLLVMLLWVFVSINRSAPALPREQSTDFLKGILTSASVVGIVAALVAYTYLLRRVGSDLRFLAVLRIGQKQGPLCTGGRPDAA